MAKNITIVPFDQSHIEDTAEIEVLCFSEPWSAASLALLTTEQGGGLAAMADGRTVGYVGSLSVIDELEITNVAVHPAYRRRGIGAALLGALIDVAHTENAVRITLDVRQSNEAALALYEKFGFTPCGRRKNFYSAPKEDAIVMEWKPQ